MKKNHPRIIILGAGPCGLGAAWRLKELGYQNYAVYDQNPYPGGLATSFQDEKGFTWDIGGHVTFSHYDYFDRVYQTVLDGEWHQIERKAFAYQQERFIPYPVQNNIRYYEPEVIWECVEGLLHHPEGDKPNNFYEWLIQNFGEGLAKTFMIPYNEKVWACPVKEMSYQWIGERVSRVSLEGVLKNIFLKRDDKKWGPNSYFRYPLVGGTGALWKRVYEKIGPENFHLSQKMNTIDAVNKKIHFENGDQVSYDTLISTVPLDLLVKNTNLGMEDRVEGLKHSAVHCFGIGIKAPIPEFLADKCWIYFPEKKYPFYRGTVLSRYSPNNTPDPKTYYSLLLEVSASEYRPVNLKSLKQEVINSLIGSNFIPSEKEICHVWEHCATYGYPTPSLKRDESLEVLHDLEKIGIYSRGRFGAWKYEVSNQDHTFMQGVEVVNNLVEGTPEITVWNPEKINAS